jgi:hypothetical protein
MKEQPYSQPIPEKGREYVKLYDQAGWDRFLKTHPATPAALYLPLVAILLYRSYQAPGFMGSTWVLFFSGLFLWTLLEYGIHRGLLHFADVNALWNMNLARIHTRHHEHPEDISQVIISPIQTLPLTALLYGILRVFLNWEHAGALLAGIAVGYLAYETFHYLFHAPISMQWRWLSALRKYHARHHFETPDARFGVTTPLWDFVFPPRKVPAPSH